MNDMRITRNDLPKLLIDSPSSILSSKSHRNGLTRKVERRVSFSIDGIVLSKNSSLEKQNPNINSALSNNLRPEKPFVKDTAYHEFAATLNIDGINSEILSNSNEINAKNVQNGYTALMIAAADESDHVLSFEMCKVLLFSGASFLPTDHMGYTCLHWATAVGNTKVVRLFCDNGISVNEKSNEGETALHRAARFGHFDIIKMLVSGYNADINLRNKKHETAYDVSGEFKEDTVVKKNKIHRSLIELNPSFRTLVLHHPDCLDHVPKENHQESPRRVESIIDRLNSEYGSNPVLEMSTDFELVPFEILSMVHNKRYVDLLKKMDHQVNLWNTSLPLTPRLQIEFQGTLKCNVKPEETCDTAFSKGTMAAARRAAGAVCHGIDMLLGRKFRNVFCVVRPPGHHAGRNGLLTDGISCGFCIFNNIMTGAKYALKKYSNVIERVAIVDFDVHHGNGTEDIIRSFDAPDRLFMSSIHIHGGGFYPRTGKDTDFAWNCLNCPLTPCWSHNSKIHESGRKGFRYQLLNRVLPALRSFRPSLILISAGFDGCKNDIGNQYGGKNGLDLLPKDFYWATKQIQYIANICCDGRVLSVLEGGYGHVSKDRKNGEIKKQLNLNEFVACSLAHVKALSGESFVDQGSSTKASPLTSRKRDILIEDIVEGCFEDPESEDQSTRKPSARVKKTPAILNEYYKSSPKRRRKKNVSCL